MRTVIHLLFKSYNATSSVAIRPTFPNMALAKRLVFLGWCRERPRIRDRTIKISKYFVSPIQGSDILEAQDMEAQQT